MNVESVKIAHESPLTQRKCKHHIMAKDNEECQKPFYP